MITRSVHLAAAPASLVSAVNDRDLLTCRHVWGTSQSECVPVVSERCKLACSRRRAVQQSCEVTCAFRVRLAHRIWLQCRHLDLTEAAHVFVYSQNLHQPGRCDKKVAAFTG